MALDTPQAQKTEQHKLVSFTDAAMSAVTGEMVSTIAETGVKMVEMADDLLQPETMSLLKSLPEVAENLERVLMEVKRLEETGVLKSLIQLADMAAAMKGAMTGPMVTEMTEKAIKGVELADQFVQLGAIDLVEGALTAFHNAQEDTKGKEPMSTMQMMKALTHRDTRESMTLMLTLLKYLPKELNK